ncbi:HAMP domain-containing histidine kinase [Paenibacillus sp. 19GGS1-52]|uniref:sensor histidine kinase n=1 Tax=Paenibacillus sp. 19GGS1-52 TaxID=2758563 RepID=UPI001EFA9DF7|nr:HAMP domain-containing sensor histidine kinase [Paenibacillus sp. 19GGS1-52]ULO09913.1 HAMP domain-containing histidine kinase [Paenibacillus sp. 19GGS1-52]
MIKSLYVRVVVIFLGAVILSIFAASLLINRLYVGQMQSAVQDNMILSGKVIIQAYEQADDYNLDSLMKGISSLPLYSVRVYDSEGIQLYTSGEASDKQNVRDVVHLQSVLQGGVYRSNLHEGNGGLTVGLPFSVNGSSRALFITPELGELFSMIAGFLKTQLLLILGFGSVLILIAATYIVRPLQLLTRATRRMAKGDFTVSLHTKRRDEIGELTRSFNVMAQELGTLEAIRKQFVSDVSHEIQSPLTSIKGFTQALKHKQLDEPSRMRLLNIIEEESDRLSRLSGDLLQLSTLEYEHFELESDRYSLDEQLRKIVIAFEPQWSVKLINVELELQPLSIVADEDKLSQIWTNLISNSIKFTGSGGRITITAAEKGDQLVVQMADNGVGVPEEELSHIFKPFYKIDKSRDRLVGGSGIGLSIVKRIVDLHHGQIEVSSKPGEGTTFTVWLPLIYTKLEL